MTVFVDTSAILPLLDADSRARDVVTSAWNRAVADGDRLVTSSYALLETFALCQNRLGLAAVRALAEHLCPLLDIEWIGAESHETGVAMLLAANRQDLSLVDCISFDLMRRLGISRVLTLDGHFGEQGFECLP